MNKIIKIEIIKPLEDSWNDFGNVLFEIQKETREILNKSIQLCWEYEGFNSEYKNINMVYPKIKDVTGFVRLDSFIYDSLKTKYNKQNTSNYTTVIVKATDRWKSDLKEIIKGEKSVPEFKKNQPISLHNKSMSILKENEDYILNMSLLSNTYKKELDRKSGQFSVLLKVSNNNQKSTLDKILNDEYKLCASELVRDEKKKKWFINLCFGFEAPKKDLDSNKILGIDLGIVNVATMQIYNKSTNNYDWLKYNECMISGKELIHFRQQTETRRRDLAIASKYVGDGRIGHGYKTRMKPLNKLNDKISNFRDTYNHKISRYIIDFALKHNCGTIQMEKLSGVATKQTDSFLKNWTYYDLETKIQYKAKEHGISVIFISPEYTSLRCNKCGCIHKDNRDCKNNQAKFKCVVCGHEDNADINASRNIAMPDIEKIIEETLLSK